MKKIPYTIPCFGQQEINAINELLHHPEKILAETYTKLCRDFLRDYYRAEVLLTHSCTAALEMSALLLGIRPGDEVIIPSYTFVSTANAFAMFGAKPVFVDMNPDTLNINVEELEAAITSKTKAIVVMHYAAVACEMDRIIEIANKYHLPIIEDAAQCIGATFKNKKLGTIGQLGALSFHYTKNITAGLGGALIINDEQLIDRAKVIWQKGTNREAFLEGNVDKYTWQDLGSSYMMSEFGAALLYGQLNRLPDITQKRLAIWDKYHHSFAELETTYAFKRPTIPTDRQHNAHIYHLIAPTEECGMKLRHYLAEQGVNAPLHYVPLHLAPAGQRLSGEIKSLPICETLYKRIVRLPLWEDMQPHVDAVIAAVYDGVKN